MSHAPKKLPPPFHLVEVAVELVTGPLDELLSAIDQSNFTYSEIDSYSGQAILGARSEAELTAGVQRLRDGFFCGSLNVGQVHVAYVEGIAQPAIITFTHKRPGPPQFAKVVFNIEPLAPGSDVALVNAVPAAVLPGQLADAALDGVAGACRNGLIAGYPVTGFRATLVDAAWHELDSSPLAFEIAGRAAFRELRNSAPILLEPVMTIEAKSPPSCSKRLRAHLQACGAWDLQQTAKAGAFKALGRLVDLLGVEAEINRLCSGQAKVVLSFDHWAEVPRRPDGDDTYLSDLGMRA